MLAAIPVQACGTVLCLLLLQSMPVAQYRVCCYSSTILSNHNVFSASPINARGTIPGLLLFHYKPEGHTMFAVIPGQVQDMTTCLPPYKPLAQYHVWCYSSTRLWCITRFVAITAQTHSTILSFCSSR